MKRLIFLLAPVLLLLLALPVLARAQDQELNRAGVVVRFGDDQVATACVQFPEPSISGLQLLERSGIPIVAQGSGIGAAVCKIENEGCDYPAEDCFCKRDGARSTYWAYSRLREGAWAYSPLGASSTKVLPGDVDGWAWGDGDTQTGAQPPLLTFEQLCALAVQPPAEQPTVPPQPSVAPTRPAATATLPLQPTAVPAVISTEASATTVPTRVEPTATSEPTAVALVSTIVPTAVATAPTAVATSTPTAVRAPEPVAGATSPLNYLAFGVIALALVVGIAIVLRRQA